MKIHAPILQKLTMKLEDQVVSLKLSKRLKELGMQQESLYYWNHVALHDVKTNEQIGEDWELSCFGSNKHEKTCSAFTVAELLEDMGSGFSLWSNGEWWYCNNDSVIYIEGDKNPSNALAKLKIHLIEANLLSPAQDGKKEE